MRNLFLLALMGLLSIVATGCAIVQQVAHDTCVTDYNRFVCPDNVKPGTTCKWARARFVVRQVGGKRTSVTTFRSDGMCIAERALVQAAAKKVPGLSCQWTTSAQKAVCR